jgi:hypothetical protein
MATSVGQRCLSILEIGTRVAHELSKLEGSEWSDLVNLGRTCRALREPALDEYWYEVLQIENLMQQMPRQLWDPKENPEDQENPENFDEESDEEGAGGKVPIPA